MTKILVLLILSVFLFQAQAWRGAQIVATNQISLNGATHQDIDLQLNATTFYSTEKVLIAATMTVVGGTAGQEISLMLFRDGENLLGIPLMVVRFTNAGESQPVCFTYVDSPDAAKTTQYSIKVSGSGYVSYNARVRQFVAIVIPAAGSNGTNGPVSAPDTASALAPVTSTAESVLVLWTMSALNLAQPVDFELQFLRAGAPLHPRVAFGLAPGGVLSASMGMVDSPASASSVFYSVVMSKDARSSAAVSLQSEKSTLSAIPFPSALHVRGALDHALGIDTPDWTEALHVKVQPTSAADKVLLMFNGDLLFSTGEAASACLTLFRGETNLGGDAFGLQSIESSAEGARRSLMMLFLDAPGTTAQVRYSVRVRAPEGRWFVLGQQDGRGTTLDAILLVETAPRFPPPLSAAPMMASFEGRSPRSATSSGIVSFGGNLFWSLNLF